MVDIKQQALAVTPMGLNNRTVLRQEQPVVQGAGFGGRLCIEPIWLNAL